MNGRFGDDYSGNNATKKPSVVAGGGIEQGY